MSLLKKMRADLLKCVVISTMLAVSGVFITMAMYRMPKQWMRKTDNDKVVADRTPYIAAAFAGVSGLLAASGTLITSGL